MKRFVIPIIILLLVSFQNSLFEFIRIMGVKPDIVLTFIICYTLIKGNPEGTIAGIIGGIAEDIFSGIAFGINSIGCMITSFLIGSIETKIYKDSVFIPGIFTFIGTIIKELIAFLFLYLTRAQRDIVSDVLYIILPEAIYNAIIAALFYKFIAKLGSRFNISKPGGYNT